MPDPKYCPKCDRYLSPDSFNKNVVRKDGLERICRSCRAEYRKGRIHVATAWRRRIKTEVFDAYGNICACCAETEPAFLSIDHVNGGGRKERGTGSNYRIYASILGYCPHGGVLSQTLA